jgi:hypothetical protein
MSLLRSKSAQKTSIPAPKMCSKFSSLHSKPILTKACLPGKLHTCLKIFIPSIILMQHKHALTALCGVQQTGYFIFSLMLEKSMSTLIDFMFLDSLQHVLQSWDKFIPFNLETKMGERQTNLSSIFLILFFTIRIVHYILMQNKWLTQCIKYLKLLPVYTSISKNTISSSLASSAVRDHIRKQATIRWDKCQTHHSWEIKVTPTLIKSFYIIYGLFNNDITSKNLRRIPDLNFIDPRHSLTLWSQLKIHSVTYNTPQFSVSAPFSIQKSSSNMKHASWFSIVFPWMVG